MSSTPDLDIRETVRAANNIVDVVGSTLELRRQGAGYVARCPWHDDQKPSLTINPVRQSWKCWPCDIGGDVFSFVMKRDGVSFPEALKILADRAGIQLPRSGKPVVKGSVNDKTALMEVVRWAESRFYQYLESSPDAQPVRDYLNDRGITEESRKQFRLGFAPDKWTWLFEQAMDQGYQPELLEACGLALSRKSRHGHVDFFRGRLMFPIYDLQDRPIAFGGRHVPGIGEQSGGKYINTSDTRLFSKSQHLYALSLARKTLITERTALVMEGYTDVIAAHQHGISTAVACLGVAVGASHIELLKRFADRIVLVLDGDNAGQRRADQVLELFVSADVDVRILTLPQGQDPAEFLDASGTDAFNQLISNAPDAIEHKLQRKTEGIDITRDTHAASQSLDEILTLVAASPADASSLRLEQVLMRLSRTFRLPLDTLRKRMQQLRSKKRYRPAMAPTPVAPPTEEALPPITGIDRELFELMVEKEELVPQALEAIDPNWLSSKTAQRLMQIYEEMEFAGQPLSADHVLLAIESPQIKSKFVSLQETVEKKAPAAAADSGQRMLAVIERYRGAEMENEKRQRISELETSILDEEEEVELLKQMFDRERYRQGIHQTQNDTPPSTGPESN